MYVIVHFLYDPYTVFKIAGDGAQWRLDNAVRQSVASASRRIKIRSLNEILRIHSMIRG